MTQPELGNKISELRLAKGLTQTELAESCNVSLRTIQRIEAAEVIPRAYTVKQIIEALGQSDYFDVQTAQNERSRREEKDWFSDQTNSNPSSRKKMEIVYAIALLLGSLGLTLIGVTEYLKTKNYQKNDGGLPEISFDFVSEFNAGEMENIGSIFLNTATMLPLDHTELHGRDEIINYYKDVYDTGFRLISEKVNFSQITDSVAIEHGSWTGWNRQNFQGSYMAQWKKVNGKWYIENYISNHSREY